MLVFILPGLSKKWTTLRYANKLPQRSKTPLMLSKIEFNATSVPDTEDIIYKNSAEN